jgi:hypothetical protein
MSFLSRALVVIGLSFVTTLVLMVIHWEPERPAPVNIVETAPLDLLAKPEPGIHRATDVRTAASKALHDGDGVDWTMQDARDIDGLPAEARAALAGCVVPRSPEFPNVISGQFKQAGQTDVAVLCVRGPSAAVYVFWGGNAGGADLATLVDFIPGTVIRTARAADISVEVRRELPIEPGMPLQIRHDGIQLGNGCCPTTYYWHRGRWRSYVSAD